MENVVVTHKSNVELDENGDFVFDNDGNIVLIDENAIGLLLKTHGVPVTVEGNIGLISRSEVLWEHKRSPAPCLELPEDLVWLSYGEEEDDEPDEEYEDVEEFEDAHYEEHSA